MYFNEKSDRQLDELISKSNIPNRYFVEIINASSIFKDGKNRLCQLLNIIIGNFHILLHFALIWKNKELTLNYKLKAINMFASKFQLQGYTAFLNYSSLRVSLPRRIIVRSFGNKIGVAILKKFLTLLFKFKKIWSSNLLDSVDCLLVMHSAVISPAQDYLIWLAKTKSIKTIAIQENWDNLSSKSFIFQFPDFFATWGEQSSVHLKNYHNFRGITFEIGCIRLSEFYNFRRSLLNTRFDPHKLNQNTKKQKILFVGSGDGKYDLVNVLECLRILSKYSRQLNSRFEIVYRPHPHSPNLSINSVNVSNLGAVQVEVPGKYESNITRVLAVNEASLVVSSFSTMILESSILNKPCILLNAVYGNSKVSTLEFVNKAAHYEKIGQFKNIYIPGSDEEFLSILQSIEPNSAPKINDSKLLEWFCKDINPSHAIDAIIEDILKQTSL